MVLTGVSAIGILGTGILSYSILQDHAKNDVMKHARMMMEIATAIRHYTLGEVSPLLGLQPGDAFLPQSVPSYAAIQSFNRLRENHPDYQYREVSLNPTNPRNLALGWEKNILKQFSNNKSDKTLDGIRSTSTGQSLYIARPIYADSKTCLSCHSDPALAPTTMIERYGSATGFGWKLNDLIGAQIVSVPLSATTKNANDAFITLMTAISGVFVLTIIVLNVVLHRIIVKPIVRMAERADQISLGETGISEFDETGEDEMSLLGISFNRLRRSLEKAMSMLEDRD